MEKSYYKSPIGVLEIVCENNQPVSLTISNDRHAASAETEFIKNIKMQLDEYFSGKRQKFDIKINPKGTKFQKKVWDELQKIPYGETRSYSQIASALGNPNAQRAVGNACNKNPIMLFIPCHRVISKSGSLGGFAYGSAVKQKLFEIEKILSNLYLPLNSI